MRAGNEGACGMNRYTSILIAAIHVVGVAGCIIEEEEVAPSSGAGGTTASAPASSSMDAGVTVGAQGSATSGSGGSGGAGATDPCKGITQNGTCLSSSVVGTCVAPTEKGSTSKLVTTSCAAYQQCQIVGGVAKCAPKPGNCQPGMTQCVGTSQEQACDASGNWQTIACLGCQNSDYGAICTAFSATKQFSGHISYQARAPDFAALDWSKTLFNANAVGALVVTYVYDAQSKDMSPSTLRRPTIRATTRSRFQLSLRRMT